MDIDDNQISAYKCNSTITRYVIDLHYSIFDTEVICFYGIPERTLGKGDFQTFYHQICNKGPFGIYKNYFGEKNKTLISEYI